MKTSQASPRSLNMEEKRKLEKILMDDIEEARSAHRYAANRKRDAIIAHIQKNPPASLKRLLSRYEAQTEARKEAIDALDATERAIKKAGWRVDTSGKRPHLELASYGDLPPEVKSLDAATETAKQKFADLKRAYTIKLFAPGAEAAALFEALASDLKKMTA